MVCTRATLTLSSMACVSTWRRTCSSWNHAKVSSELCPRETSLCLASLRRKAHKCSSTFMFLDPSQDILYIDKVLKFKVILKVYEQTNKRTKKGVLNRQPDKTISVFNLVIDIYIFNPSDGSSKSKDVIPHSFIAMTSGSTGAPKQIQVPVQCMQPNIDDLTSLFCITPSDIIYFSTPLTFDPSMIEVLLACVNGASLLIAPEKVEVLFPEDDQNAITVWQTTPSKFFQHSEQSIRKNILCNRSKLRVLALGGEPLSGVSRLKKWKNLNNNTRIFTLYGVTEMSCWACAAELDLNKCNTDYDIPLGACLSETQINLQPECPANASETSNLTGKIILSSKTRKCVILNKPPVSDSKNMLFSVDTGDLGELSNGIIYYRGRRDETIKRFGLKVSLTYIQSTVMICPNVKSCSCIWLPKPRLLVVYYTSELCNTQQLSEFLRSNLEQKNWPDKLIKVDHMPVNKHGKLAKNLLLKMYEKSLQVPESPESAASMLAIKDNNFESSKPLTEESLALIILKELKSLLNPYFTYDKVKDKNFSEIGGSSFLAITLCNKLALTDPHLSNYLLPQLLCQEKTIGQIVSELSDTTSSELGKRGTKRALTEEKLEPAVKQSFPNESLEINLHWSYNSGKCIDASPTIVSTGLKLLVTAGSHSGKIVVMNVLNGEVVGEINMKSRIEASVYCCQLDPMLPTYGVVGTYKGTIECFNVEVCKEKWRINIGSMIKSKATGSNGFLYIASYDGCIRCINLLTGNVHATIQIGGKAISANLVLAKDEFVLVGTQSGVCACVHTITNSVVWRGSLTSPVFASPVLYDQDQYVVFIGVAGEIQCKMVETGLSMWKFTEAGGNLFSSIYVIPDSEDGTFKMVFGCHDSNLYCIKLQNNQTSLQWKTKLSKPIFSTPCGINEHYVLATPSDGNMCVINQETGNIVTEYQLPGETFSSPQVYNEYIFIGCRNDHLFCLRCIKKLLVHLTPKIF